MSRRGPWDSLNEIVSDITDLENKNVKAVYFEQIDSGESGTITPPAGATIDLDEFGGGADALVSEMSAGFPTYDIASEADGTPITATLDSSGNWTISGTPSSYPVALIYAYTIAFADFDDSNSIIAAELGGGGVTIEDDISVRSIQFDLGFSDGVAEGRVQWNSDDGTLEYGLPGGNVTLQVGQEHVLRCRNESGGQIDNGEVVYVSGASGNKPLLGLADADTTNMIPEAVVFGVATEDIGHLANGYVTLLGLVRDVNTLGMTPGTMLWLSEITPGAFTETKPTAPNRSIAVGMVVAASATEGVIFVRPLVLNPIMAAGDVLTADPDDNNMLQWNEANSRFELTASPVVATPTLSNQAANKEYVDSAISFIQDYFLTDTGDGIGGIYYVAADAPTGAGLGTLSTSGLTEADDQPLINFITPALFPGTNTLLAGIYDIHFHAERTGGNRPTVIYAELYTRVTGGAETLRGTSELSGLIPDADVDVDLHLTIPADVDINTDDRLVWKLYANCGVGANTTIVVYTEGVTNSHVSIPTTTEVLNSVYLRLDGTTPMTDAAKIEFDPLPASDGTMSGETSPETVDTNAIGIGALLVLAADGHWDEADADAEATCGLLSIAVESGTGSKKVMHKGWLHMAAHGFTVGRRLFVSTTQGTMTNTAPDGSGNVVQVVGYAISDDVIRINPSRDYLVVA